MEYIKIFDSEFENNCDLPFASEIKAGFPSVAEGYSHESIDFNRDLIRHPESTFYGRVYGDSMIDAGICDGDIAVIDKSMTAVDGDIIVAFINNEFTIKYLDLTNYAKGYIELRPANSDYPVIRVNRDDDFKVWGVVVWTIKKWKK